MITCMSPTMVFNSTLITINHFQLKYFKRVSKNSLQNENRIIHHFQNDILKQKLQKFHNINRPHRWPNKLVVICLFAHRRTTPKTQNQISRGNKLKVFHRVSAIQTLTNNPNIANLPWMGNYISLHKLSKTGTLLLQQYLQVKFLHSLQQYASLHKIKDIFKR